MIDIKKLYEATHQGLDIIKWMYPQADVSRKFRIRTSGDSDPSAKLYKVKQISTGRFGASPTSAMRAGAAPSTSI